MASLCMKKEQAAHLRTERALQQAQHDIERLHDALAPFAFALKAARYISYDHLKLALSETAQREPTNE